MMGGPKLADVAIYMEDVLGQLLTLLNSLGGPPIQGSQKMPQSWYRSRAAPCQQACDAIVSFILRSVGDPSMPPRSP